MRLRRIAVIIGVLLPAVAQAQADRIVLSAESNRVVCELAAPAAGFYRIHMIHQGSVPRIAVHFRAATPACWPDAVWLGDVVPPPLLKQESTHGDGISVVYATGSCTVLPGYLGYMNFYAPTPVPTCCQYPITQHLNSNGSMVVACDLTALVASTGPLTINPDANCTCSQPVPVAQSSWGRIKSLYR